MTEAECLSAINVDRTLTFLGAKATDRKLRLLAIACGRRLQNHFSVEICREALSTAERYADGEVPAEVLRSVWDRARQAARDAEDPFGASTRLLWAAAILCEPDIRVLAMAAEEVARTEVYTHDQDSSRWHEVQREQLPVFRDIFGPLPFRPVAIDPSWRTSTVLALAHQMYGSRDFSAMPILADAIQDAGCENSDVLDHCRDPNGIHVRGCWVVDLVLGKE